VTLNSTYQERRPLNAHLWAKHPEGFYIEPHWVDECLFKCEQFVGGLWDPAAGTGRIPDAARIHGYAVYASDIAHRGYRHTDAVFDFLRCEDAHAPNVVANPPFTLVRQFAEHALKLTTGKVALIMLARRLNAARWLSVLPLARVYLINPRPSMPPGPVLLAGEKPGGGKQDFVWLIFDHKHKGPPQLHWLYRGARR
jgi:hypothetical protein